MGEGLARRRKGAALGKGDRVGDLDGDGYLSREEFTELWTEFWAGDDADAPGTWVFGRFELPVSAAPGSAGG